MIPGYSHRHIYGIIKTPTYKTTDCMLHITYFTHYIDAMNYFLVIVSEPPVAVLKKPFTAAFSG